MTGVVFLAVQAHICSRRCSQQFCSVAEVRATTRKDDEEFDELALHTLDKNAGV